MIDAFTTQLEGQATAGMEGNGFRLRLEFAVETGDVAADGRNVVLTSAARAGARH